jgi:Cu+-exporting ATPase
VLGLAATLERGSEHPLASAIVEGAIRRAVPLDSAMGFQSVTGKGVTGSIRGKRVALGNSALMEQLAVDISELAGRADELRADGQTVMFLAVENELGGLIGVADPIKPGAADALKELHALGLRVIMLTGDSAVTARAVAKKLGIDEVEADVLPDRKAEVVARLKSAGKIVVMAGDGINDAPALARADVGIAMGTGTDVAIESAGVTLVKGDLRGITRAIGLSRRTMENIRQNLFLAFIYNAVCIPVAAVGVLGPIIAAAAMSLSSVSVIGNALRLK